MYLRTAKVTKGSRGFQALALLTFFFLGCGTRVFLNMSQVDLGAHLKAVLGGGGNSTILLHGSEALVVDTKLGDFARRLRHQVEQDWARRVRRVVLTHAHGDHANGLSLFHDVGTVLVHPNARKQLEAEGVRAPFIEVEDEIQLNLGGEVVRVLNRGTGHTDGDLVALLPGRKLLIAGDLITEGFEPNIDITNGGNMLNLVRTLEALMQLDFEWVVPGHGEVMTRAQAQAVLDYLHAMEAAVRAARAAHQDQAATVESVTLPDQPPLKEIPMRASRAKSVELMYRALELQANLTSP